MEMRKHKIIIAVAAIIVGIVVTFSAMVLFSSTIVLGGMDLVADYQDYYFRAVYRRGWINLGTGRVDSYGIYFLPGQRGRMLGRIREDIINELDELIEEHGDIFYRYEISDDFRQVRIYVSVATGDGRRRALVHEMRLQIGTVLQLYRSINEGRVFFRSVDSSGYGVTVIDSRESGSMTPP